MESMNSDQWVDRQLTALLCADCEPSLDLGLRRLRDAQDARRRHRRYQGAAAIGMSLVGTTILAYPATRAYARECVQACVAEAGRIGQFVLAKVGTSHPSPIREAAPDFALTDDRGGTCRLSDLRGRVVVLNFWATWCPPCRVEIPWFVEFQKVYKDQGLTIVGVSLDEDGWDAVRPFIEKQRVNYPMVLGGDEIAKLYGGLDSLPTTLIIDRQGRVAATHIGLVSRSTYEEDIQAVLAEQ